MYIYIYILFILYYIYLSSFNYGELNLAVFRQIRHNLTRHYFTRHNKTRRVNFWSSENEDYDFLYVIY